MKNNKMKKLLLILLVPVIGCGQYYESIEHYESMRSYYEEKEAENSVFCEERGLLWGVSENCGNWMRAQPILMAYDISRLNKRDIQAVADFVSKEMVEYYIKYSWDYNMFNNTIILNNKDLNIEFITGDTGRIIARAHSPKAGDNTIIVNIDKWEELNNYQRVWLMMHEWGHEAFGMKHGDNKLMYPLMPEEELLKTAYVDYDKVREISKRVKFENMANGVSENNSSARASRAESAFIRNSKKDQEEKFGNRNSSNNYDLEQFSSKVPVAMNVFFDAAVDFFDFLVKKHHTIEDQYDIYINGEINSNLPKMKELLITNIRLEK